MKKIKVLLVVFLLVSVCNLLADSKKQVGEKEKIRFPGSFWAEARFPNSPQPEDKNNWMIGGRIEQGIDWLTSQKGFTLNTFAEFGAGVDKVGHDWNNFLAPAIGIKIKKPITYNGLLQFGVKYVYEHRWKTDRQNSVIMIFVNCWLGWNL